MHEKIKGKKGKRKEILKISKIPKFKKKKKKKNRMRKISKLLTNGAPVVENDDSLGLPSNASLEVVS